jgi:hypothetical protein
MDDMFFSIFFRMKVQHHQNRSHKHKADKWAKLDILPWAEQDQFARCNKVQNIFLDFLRLIGTSINMYGKFVDIEPL